MKNNRGKGRGVGLKKRGGGAYELSSPEKGGGLIREGKRGAYLKARALILIADLW